MAGDDDVRPGRGELHPVTEPLAERVGADDDVGAAEGVELMGLEPTTS
jgi:hypothetical protein